MSNIHNNSILQNSSSSRSVKPNEAQNDSNGMGAAGYCAIWKEEEKEQDDDFVDRSDYLTGALIGLATLNSSRLRVRNGNLRKLAAKSGLKALAHIA